MKTPWKICFIISFVFHFLALGPKGCKSLVEAYNGKDSNSSEETLNKAHYEKITIRDKPKNGLGKESCTDGFGGIGISHSFSTKEITTIYEGYPAARAGLKVGDVLDVEISRGEVGTPLTLIVFRGSKRLTFNMIREKICINKLK